MNTQLNIKNFRVFGAQGTQFELSPITLLTGCNSAGKSSLVKALMILTDCLKKIESNIELNNDFSLNDVCIDFSSTQSNSMGRFDKVLNRTAERNDAITFVYGTYSNFLAEKIFVELSFVAQPNDDLNRGWLSSMLFKKCSGEVIISAKIDEDNKFYIDSMNLTSIKSNFLNWAAYSCGLNTRNNLITTRLLDDDFDGNESELVELFEQLEKSLQELQISKEAAFGYQLLLDKNDSTHTYNLNAVWQSLKHSFDSKSILYLPLVTKLNDMTKCECISYITELKNNSEISGVIKSFSDKIIAEFTASEFEIFADYYLAKEDRYGLLFEKNRQHSNFFTRDNNGLLQSIKAKANVVARGLSFFDTTSETVVLDEHNDCRKLNDKEAKERNDNRTKNFTFEDFYGTMIILNYTDDRDSLSDLIHSSPILSPNDTNIFTCDNSHKPMKVFGDYVQSITLEALSPDQLMDSKYVGSNRINVQRLYTFDDRNSDFSRLLQRYFEAKRKCKIEYVPNNFINNWLKRFNIAEAIELKLVEEGFGATIYLVKQGGERVLLADEGYGISQLVSVILEIETAILESRVYIRRTKDATAPFGLLRDNEKELCYKPSTIAIEEPEVHLHPRYQSMLAEMFVEAYKLYNIHFIIETHSEYLIRKMQTIVAKKEISNSDISLHYIDTDQDSASSLSRHIALESDGRLSSPLGSGFFDEADNLAINLLEIKAGL